jgi:O-antigen ligase
VVIPIPTIGINQLFDMNNQRLLAFTILLPALVVRFSGRNAAQFRLNRADVLLLLYGVLQLVLFIPYESSTNTLRRAFLFLLEGFLTFVAFSRLLPERRDIVDAIGGFCLAAAIFAPIAIFESLRYWLLYTVIPVTWGDPNYGGAWLLRGGSLRAQAATGHSLTLGYVFMMAIGFCMYLKGTQRSKFATAAVFSLLCAGLFFTYSRGPWLAAALVVVITIVLGARNAAQLVKITLPPVVIAMVLMATPLGRGLVNLLPFVGTADQDTIEQRQRLAETSWRLIQENPLWGNPFVMQQMEELRLGSNGIIDLVNAYAQVALFYGLIGLALFLSVYASALLRSYATLKVARAAGDADLVWLGATLIASMASCLILMAASGHLWLEWVSAGILIAYSTLQPHVQPAVEPSAVHPTLVRRRRTAAL